MPTGNWRSMRESTAKDWQKTQDFESEWTQKVTIPRVISQLKALDEGESPFPISRYEHSLQTATRAHRDGADEELVVAALLHDIGDDLALHNHAELAAAVLKPFVSRKTHWIVKHHAIFQGYYFWHHLGLDRNARDQFKDHPWYDDCVYFCEHYDQNSFDKDYDTFELDFFIPMVGRIFGRTPFEIKE